MSGLTFERPIGAGADVKELEYVIALHQTSKETRHNATISSMDIVALLKSRHSLGISHKQAIDVVRGLGGGDTDAFKTDDYSASLLAASKANRKGGHLLQRAMDGVQSIFSRHDDEAPAVADRTDQPAGAADDEEVPVESRSASVSANQRGEMPSATSHTMSSAMKRLRCLHALQHHGKADRHRVQVLTEDLTAELRAKVMEKTQSVSRLTLNDGINDDDMNERNMEKSETERHSTSNPNTGVEDNSLLQVDEQRREVETEVIPEKRTVSFTDAYRLGENQDGDLNEKPLEEAQEDQSELLPEYLDFVQILSTLLIPKFARVAYDAKTTPKKKREGGFSQTEPATEPDPGLCFRLFNRFLSYGKRKLNIHDQEPNPFSSHDILNLGKQSLLKTIPGDEDPVLDETLVQLLLLVHGEIERANDEDLVRQMVQVAQSPSGRFDKESLIHALSSDLATWDPTCQDVPTTFFYDVFDIPLPGVKTKLIKEDEGESDEDEKVDNKVVASEKDKKAHSVDKHIHPEDSETPKKSIFRKCWKTLFPICYNLSKEKVDFPSLFLGIDMVVDTSSSLIIHILIWVSFILISSVYAGLLIQLPTSDEDCGLSFSCKIGYTVYTWAVIACMLIIVGMFHIVPISVGNNPSDQWPRRQFFASFVTLVNALVPFCIVNWIQRNIEDVQNSQVKSTLDSDLYDSLQILTLAVCLILSVMFALKGLSLLIFSQDRPHELPRLLRAVVSATSWDGDTRVYKAAKLKIDKIISNALSLHKSELFESVNKAKPNLTFSAKMNLAGSRDDISRNFVTHGEKKEEVGGILWTFWKLCDGSLLAQEGIWINTRLWVIQVAQVALGLVTIIALFIGSVQTANAADESRADLDPDLPNWVVDLFPTGEMVQGSLIPAVFVAMVVIVFTIIVYIPSSTATVLKYRGQLLPSLGSPYFQKFRRGVDMTYMNTANAVYGVLGSGILVFLIVGLVIFLFAWPVTQEAAVMLTAWGIGLGVTIGIKMFVTGACRKAQYRAYYRIKPASARISSLALECWFIGLAGSVLIARITQFLAAAVFWVGRIDVPYLSQDVVLFGYKFDTVPTHFCKDLLVHEAHRHPYIEQLTQMYLMKLRHGDRFVSNACTAWRQLLILAMMPWVSKYRVFKDERRIAAEQEAQFEIERESEEQDQLLGLKDMEGGVVQVGHGVANEVMEAGGEIYGAGADIVDEFGKLVKKGTSKVTGMVEKSSASLGEVGDEQKKTIDGTILSV